MKDETAMRKTNRAYDTIKETPPYSVLQLGRLKKAARYSGCDEDEAAFHEKLQMIARQRARVPANEKPTS